MPYIPAEEERELIEPAVKVLVSRIMRAGPGETDGRFNYAASRLMGYFLHTIKAGQTANYAERQRTVGLIQCVKDEFVRRNLNDYEDSKMRENGDVYDPSTFESLPRPAKPKE